MCTETMKEPVVFRPRFTSYRDFFNRWFIIFRQKTPSSISYRA